MNFEWVINKIIWLNEIHYTFWRINHQISKIYLFVNCAQNIEQGLSIQNWMDVTMNCIINGKIWTQISQQRRNWQIRGDSIRTLYFFSVVFCLQSYFVFNPNHNTNVFKSIRMGMQHELNANRMQIECKSNVHYTFDIII